MAQHEDVPEAANDEGGGEVVLSARDITVAFSGKVILDHLSLDIRRGEILGFVGASGAGKTVLLRTVLGLIPKRAGTIEMLGVDLERASLAERATDAISSRNSAADRRQANAVAGSPSSSWGRM